MTLKTEVIGKVNEILPYGSKKLIHRRLIAKNIHYSYQYVWRCLSMQYTDESFDVTQEAALLCEEIFKHKAEQRRAINFLHDRKYNNRKAV
ncbi:MAG: hypothetical protein WCI71_16555 [Bacteroidota bacterium]